MKTGKKKKKFFFLQKAMFWNLPSKFVKWNEETYISGPHTIDLDHRHL